MDLNRRHELIKRIKEQGLPTANKQRPVVSLEEFFIGNDDLGSIGCNLADHPGIQKFYNILKAIREKHEVQDVLIEIHEVEESDESMWPFSERVYILTHCTREQVKKWVSELEPDEITEGYGGGVPPAAPQLEAKVTAYAVWWD
jgi:hypothetical protein